MVERDKGRYIDEQLLFVVVVVLFVPFVVLFVIKDEKLRLPCPIFRFAFLFFFDNQTTTNATKTTPREGYQERAYFYPIYPILFSLLRCTKTNREEQQQPENTNGRRRTSLRNC